MSSANFKFECGDEVKDKISGVKGVVVSRTEYLTSCNRYAIAEKKKPETWLHFDELQLEKTSAKRIVLEVTPVEFRTGGTKEIDNRSKTNPKK